MKNTINQECLPNNLKKVEPLMYPGVQKRNRAIDPETFQELKDVAWGLVRAFEGGDIKTGFTIMTEQIDALTTILEEAKS